MAPTTDTGKVRFCAPACLLRFEDQKKAPSLSYCLASNFKALRPC